MKKILSVFIFIGVVMLAACKMEIPKTFAVKLKSQYGFSLGSYSKNLSEYISLDSITEGIARQYVVPPDLCKNMDLA